MSADGIWKGLDSLKLTEDDKLLLEELREDRPKCKALLTLIEGLVRLKESELLSSRLSASLESDRDTLLKKARAEGARDLKANIALFFGSVKPNANSKLSSKEDPKKV